MSVELRDMQWPDLAALDVLEKELFGPWAWSQATWWRELAGRPRRRYVVATDDEEIVGYAGLDHGGDVADVMTIAVAPTHQGTGLGRSLMEWLLAQAAGSEAVLLEVRADNAPAIALYEKFGFEQIQVRRRYYQPGDIDALILRRLM
ncbi:ribosomal-protein-alanine N-acetyltransferase [Branchiibius hedensis]|uniref:[Ribosomal protein bS18]-alanine N-acetyltransferase n=1 Tax=Branchiibius hedensis TaxID=672460 RepID=A0A2Y8ZUR2_9MICO|nr:ribosomal-protein-alanine N-acetyltransferase [Branchiibius hedensis]SSA35008.1 ribosomal-protein-alanine N-acetyltransferase [Branchiibius hedensis]